MSLLTIVQDAADLIGLPRPGNVAGNNDTQARQLFALVNREGSLLSRRHDWQVLQAESTFLTVNAELQGTMNNIMPGFRWPVNSTQWNRTQQEPLGGPLSAQEWQALQAFTVTGPYQDFRFRDGNLYLIPAPPAGETLAFEYISSYWALSEDSSGQSRMVKDGDTTVLDEELIVMGVHWRFLRAKGMDYAEEFTDYESEVSRAISRDATKRIMYLDRSDIEPFPTIRAPIGSWNLP